MATITIRTDNSTEELLKKLQSENSIFYAKRNSIIKAAILAFSELDPNVRGEYLCKLRNNDGRLARYHLYY